MPTDKPRTMITFKDKELHERVEAYRFEKRFKSQNDAIMFLLNKGIEQLTGEIPADTVDILSDEDRYVLRAYHAADERAQQDALNTLLSHPVDKKVNLAQPNTATCLKSGEKNDLQEV